MHDHEYTGPGKYSCYRARTHEEVEQASSSDEQAAKSGLSSREPMKPRHLYPEVIFGLGYNSRG